MFLETVCHESNDDLVNQRREEDESANLHVAVFEPRVSIVISISGSSNRPTRPILLFVYYYIIDLLVCIFAYQVIART